MFRISVCTGNGNIPTWPDPDATHWVCIFWWRPSFSITQPDHHQPNKRPLCRQDAFVLSVVLVVVVLGCDCHYILEAPTNADRSVGGAAAQQCAYGKNPTCNIGTMPPVDTILLGRFIQLLAQGSDWTEENLGRLYSCSHQE